MELDWAEFTSAIITPKSSDRVQDHLSSSIPFRRLFMDAWKAPNSNILSLKVKMSIWCRNKLTRKVKLYMSNKFRLHLEWQNTHKVKMPSWPCDRQAQRMGPSIPSYMAMTSCSSVLRYSRQRVPEQETEMVLLLDEINKPSSPSRATWSPKYVSTYFFLRWTFTF